MQVEVYRNKNIEAFFKINSPRTRQLYRKALENFFQQSLESLNLDTIKSVTLPDILNYRQGLIEQGYSHSTINIRLNAIRTFFRYLAQLGIIEKNPAPADFVRGLKQETVSNKEILTQDEAKSLLEAVAIEKNPVTRARDRAILLLMLLGGLRKGEITQIHVNDLKINGNEGILILNKTKSQVRQKIKLNKIIIDALNEYLRLTGIEKDSEGFLFYSNSNRNKNKPLRYDAIRFILNKYKRLAGIEKNISPHSLRHTAATLALQGGAPIHKVQEHLRHSDPRTTMKYYHNIDFMENNAVDYIKL